MSSIHDRQLPYFVTFRILPEIVSEACRIDSGMVPVTGDLFVALGTILQRQGISESDLIASLKSGSFTGLPLQEARP